jgi:hypothetical protein
METVRIQDPGWKKVGSGITSRISHTGSASATKSGDLHSLRLFTDPDRRIRTNRIKTVIRIRLFSSFNFKMPEESKFLLSTFMVY